METQVRIKRIVELTIARYATAALSIRKCSQFCLSTLNKKNNKNWKLLTIKETICRYILTNKIHHTMEEYKIKREDVPDVLRTALKAGKTNFVFIKKDGSRRAAVGTLNLDDVPEADKQFKHSESEQVERPDQTSYYDLEKSGWRCCKFDSVVKIEEKEVE